MNKEDKIHVLAEFKELQELKSKADRRIKEIKTEIEAKFKAGKYGDYLLHFEIREVREYVVPARVDRIVKVDKI